MCAGKNLVSCFCCSCLLFHRCPEGEMEQARLRLHLGDGSLATHAFEVAMYARLDLKNSAASRHRVPRLPCEERHESTSWLVLAE